MPAASHVIMPQFRRSQTLQGGLEGDEILSCAAPTAPEQLSMLISLAWGICMAGASHERIHQSHVWTAATPR